MGTALDILRMLWLIHSIVFRTLEVVPSDQLDVSSHPTVRLQYAFAVEFDTNIVLQCTLRMRAWPPGQLLLSLTWYVIRLLAKQAIYSFFSPT